MQIRTSKLLVALLVAQAPEHERGIEQRAIEDETGKVCKNFDSNITNSLNTGLTRVGTILGFLRGPSFEF